MLMLGVVAAALAPQRVIPLVTFLPECMAVLACCIGAVVVGCMKATGASPRWGWSMLGPLMLAAWIVICIPFAPIQYADSLIFPVASLLVAAVAAGMGRACADRRQLGALCLILGVAWVAASLTTVVLQYIQLYNPDRVEVWLVPRQPDMQPFGNLAQRNQAACVHALALMSLAFMWVRFAGRSWRALMALAALFILSGLVLTGSRSGSVFGAFAALFFAWLVLLSKDGKTTVSRTVLSMGWALAAYVVAYAILQFGLFSLEAAQSFTSATTRWSTTGNVSRVVLFQLALEIFLAYPVTGSGWGTFTLQSLQRFQSSSIPQFANHSHNILTQLAAETGIVGLLVFAIPLCMVLWRALRSRQSRDTGYLLICCLTLLAYSMVEFPLWHTYFLLSFALMLGALDRTGFVVRLSGAMRALLVTMGIAMGAATLYMANQYVTIAHLVWTVFRPGEVSPELRHYIGAQLKMPGFSPQTELLVFGVLPVSREQLDQKIELGARVVRQYSDAKLLTKYAGLLALKGDFTSAAGYAMAACRFHPEKCSLVEKDLEQLADLEPAVFGPVLKEFKAMQADGATRSSG